MKKNKLVTRHFSLSTTFQDIKFGIRMLIKQPGVTVFALMALAIGIGANTALFSLIYAVMLSPLPFQAPDKLVWVESYWRNSGSTGSVSAPDFLDWEEQNSAFVGMALMNTGSKYSLTGVGEPIALRGIQVTTNFFDLIGEPPVLGRGFLPEEGQSGNDHVVVLSHRLWEDLFEADPNIVGRQITLGQEPWTIVGVLNPTMGFIRRCLSSKRREKC